MKTYRLNTGETVRGEDAAAVVGQMLNVSRTPAPDLGQFMREAAARAALQTGATFRSDTAEHFLDDLVAAGLVSELYG